MSQIYLDYNATTPLGESVVEIIHKALKESWGNPSSLYNIGKEAKELIKNAREQVAQMLGTESSCIIFTSGGTESSNMSIASVVKYTKKSKHIKPHVITSSVEHDATLKILKHLQQEDEIDLSVVRPTRGIISVAAILNCINDKSCLISIMMANNETGVIFPIPELGKSLEGLNEKRKHVGLPTVFLHTDAAQVIGKLPLLVEDVKADYISIAGHKFYGPRIGCLYYKKGVPLEPLLFGGGQELGLRPGTENTPMIAGLGEAARLVTENIADYREHFSRMRNQLQSELQTKFSEEDLKLNLTDVPRLPNTLSISFVNRNGRDVLSACSFVVASTGSACHSDKIEVSRVIQEFLEEEFWRGTIRLSAGRETTSEEIRLAALDLHTAFILTAPGRGNSTH